jgi:excisionase family DNA binding protein
MSRPFLVNLREEGKIPFHNVGSHRRIRAEDLFKYRGADQTRVRELLAQMTAEAQEI